MSINKKPFVKPPGFDEAAIYGKQGRVDRDRTKALFKTSAFRYLEAKQIAANNNAIQLSSDLSAKPGRILEVPTDYAFYKVNSVLYPILDVNANLFIEADRWYPVVGGAIKLNFPIIASAGLGQDCIYADSCSTLDVSTPVFYLYVTQTNNPSIPVGNYKQELLLKSSSSGLDTTAYFLFNNADTFSVIARNSDQTRTPRLIDMQRYYDISNLQFSTVLTTGWDLNDGAGFSQYFIAQRRQNIWIAESDSVEFYGALGVNVRKISYNRESFYMQNWNSIIVTIQD